MTIEKKDIRNILFSIAIADFIIFALFTFFLKNGNEYQASNEYERSGSNLVTDPDKSFLSEISAENVPDPKDLDVNVDFSEKRNSSMEELFRELIIGNYSFSTGISFEFGNQGDYSGFFDSSNQKVRGYSYEIVAINESVSLNIYNPEKTAVVTYELQLSDLSEVILVHPGTGTKITLK